MVEGLQAPLGKRKRRSQRNEVALPWEGRTAWARHILAGRRWKLVVGLGALVALATWVYEVGDRRRRTRETYATIAETRHAVQRFQLEVGRCPRSMTELVHPPRTRSRYLREIPKDGWGQALWVQCPGRDDPDGVDVVSAGPSGSFSVDDNLR